MPTFDTVFPGFIKACVSLHDSFMPVGMALLTLSFVFFFWHGVPDSIDLIKFIAKLTIIAVLIQHSHGIMMGAQKGVVTFVQAKVPARPENVAERYREKVQATQGENSNKSWLDSWRTLFSANFFEAFVYGVMLVVAWLAMVVQFYLSIFQSIVLYLCWVMTPVLFACFAIPMVSGLAMRHVLRIVGVLCWPIGIAMAATITDGLIDIQTDQKFFASYQSQAAGTIAYVAVNLMAVASIGVWILFSSFAAPVLIQRLFAGQAGAAGLWTRAGSLMADRGVPWATSKVTELRNFVSGGRGGTRPSRPAQGEERPTLISVPEPSAGAPTDPPTVRPLSADDPTADNAVRQILNDETKE